MNNIFRSQWWTSERAWLYLRASWVPVFGLTRDGMLLITTLGCQRRQKSAPKRLPEVGLSLVRLTSVHIALVVAPVDSTFALAKLCCTVGPADIPCCTTAGFWTLLAGRQRKCSMWHLTTMTGASSNVVQAGRGSRGRQWNKNIQTISITT